MHANSKQMPWFVVQIKPHCLKVAERNLRQQQFTIFSPRRKVPRRRASGFQQVLEPLFPGYVFISFDPESAGCRAINATYGVARLVSFHEYAPVRVPDALVAAVRARCDSNNLFIERDAIGTGDAVHVVKGPFASLIGTVECLGPQERAWILLDILGRQTRVHVDTANLLRVQSNAA
ncbi:transcription termination/antitermination protein NusG [Sphingosinicella sp.]|jgi:transcriptional antiterminator RfaH|uniref:transcription termination/antitermination protein NusG n=1 Tax=Sphingosinicella sp. TaxID=1917971 RepID=UPI0035B1EF28